MSFGDALMSYSTPVYIEKRLNSAFLMGLILSTSSLFGTFLDFYISKKYWNKKYGFFLKLAFIATLMFPLILIFFPAKPLFLIVGMLSWGAYYELRGFSNFNFINKHTNPDNHTLAWSILNTFNSLAYFIGPMLSVYLIEIGDKTTFYFALIPFGLAITTHYMFTKKHSLNKREHGINLLTQSNERNLEIEGKIMKILITRAWPIFIFGFTLWLLDASFWTIGTLFSEQLKHSSKYGSFFFAAYMIPPIFTSIFATHIYKRFGKKRTAFISAIFSALILLVMAATNNVGYILICVFFVSIFYNLAQILNYSVYEDFVTRLHQYGNDMVAIGQVSASLAYITGPVIFGLISSYIGYQSTFSIVGIILGSVSIACLFVVPRKIKMPQIELKHLTDR